MDSKHKVLVATIIALVLTSALYFYIALHKEQKLVTSKDTIPPTENIKTGRETSEVATTTDTPSLISPNGARIIFEEGDPYDLQIKYPDTPTTTDSIKRGKIILVTPTGERHLIYETPMVDHYMLIEEVGPDGTSFSPSGKYASTKIEGYEWRWDIIFDTETGEVILGRDNESSYGLHSITWSPDNQFLAFQVGLDIGAGRPDAVYLLRLKDGKILPVVTADEESKKLETPGIEGVNFADLRFLDETKLIFDGYFYKKETVKMSYVYSIVTQQITRNIVPLK